MAKRGAWETVKIQGGQVVDEVRRLIQEGNVRRVVVKQQGQVVAEFPLTVGVLASVAAPVLAAIGALVALLTECSIVLERRKPSGAPASKPKRPAARKKARTRTRTVGGQ